MNWRDPDCAKRQPGGKGENVMAPTDLNVDPIFLEAIANLPDGNSIFDKEGRPMLHNWMSEKRFSHLYAAFAAGARNYREAMAHSAPMSRPDFTDAQITEQVDGFENYTETGQT